MIQPPLLDDLSPPDWLSVADTLHWNKLAPALRECEVLTVLDVRHLAVLCHLLAEYERLQAEIDEHGPATRGEQGELRKHPHVEMLKDTRRLLADFASDFIVCPRSRAAVYAAIPSEIRNQLTRQYTNPKGTK